MTDTQISAAQDNPLSSAQLRNILREPMVAPAGSTAGSRPFGLRFARAMPLPATRTFSYCHERQVAVDAEGHPLIETMGKEWKSKSSTDGDEGPEENWGWEEG